MQGNFFVVVTGYGLKFVLAFGLTMKLPSWIGLHGCQKSSAFLNQIQGLLLTHPHNH